MITVFWVQYTKDLGEWVATYRHRDDRVDPINCSAPTSGAALRAAWRTFGSAPALVYPKAAQ